jgi:hypothetical protein
VGADVEMRRIRNECSVNNPRARLVCSCPGSSNWPPKPGLFAYVEFDLKYIVAGSVLNKATFIFRSDIMALSGVCARSSSSVSSHSEGSPAVTIVSSSWVATPGSLWRHLICLFPDSNQQ